VEPLLVVRRALREQIVILHRRLLAIVRDDEVCRRLMTTPGVGPVVALTCRVTVDVPARFRKSKSVGAVFGLTCSRYQSGEIDWSGRISRCGEWKDVPRGTMDQVSSHVRLNLPFELTTRPR
jgi:transposase